MFVVALFICGFSFASAFHVDDCGSQVGSFSTLTITSCKDVEPVCVLKRGTNETMVITFTTTAIDRSVQAVVHGVLAGIPVPWPIPNPDACTDSGLSCPLQPGKTYRYNVTFPVLHTYPKVHLQVKWELKNEQNKDIICTEFPVQVK